MHSSRHITGTSSRQGDEESDYAYTTHTAHLKCDSFLLWGPLQEY